MTAYVGALSIRYIPYKMFSAGVAAAVANALPGATVDVTTSDAYAYADGAAITSAYQYVSGVIADYLSNSIDALSQIPGGLK